jgi:hypothetical protein
MHFFRICILALFASCKTLSNGVLQTLNGNYTDVPTKYHQIYIHNPYCTGCLESLMKELDNIKFDIIYLDSNEMSELQMHMLINKVQSISSGLHKIYYLNTKRLENKQKKAGVKVSWLTPYFKIKASDSFIYYDSIFYTKKTELRTNFIKLIQSKR